MAEGWTGDDAPPARRVERTGGGQPWRRDRPRVRQQGVERPSRPKNRPASLDEFENELPLLAEAAPDPLLGALEHMLEGDGALIRPIFNEHEGFLHPTYKHTGVLWALETMAWDPEYFRRAVLALARLAAIDPGVKIGNTPANSLAEIFVLWHPNTNASSAQLLSALNEIAQSFPEVGWKLVTTLLPTWHARIHSDGET